MLVTGASTNHGSLLILMIYKTLIEENNLCLVIWDLGLSSTQKRKIKKIIDYVAKNKSFNLYINYHLFRYTLYPNYFNININAGNYAWKPVIIYETYHRYRKTLFWLDAGCYINGSLLSIYRYIKNNEIWSISSGHSIMRYTHYAVINYFNITKKIQKETMCSAGVVGFLYPSLLSNKILKLWRDCAFYLNCIAPNGSNRMNHRQDQSALSIILHKNGYKYKCIKYRNLNFSLQYDAKINKNKDISFHLFMDKISPQN